MTSKVPFSRPLAGVFIVGQLSGILIGYVTAVIAGALLLISAQFSLSAEQQGLLVSIILAGGFIGSLICHYFTRPFGQKKTLMLIAVLFGIGSLWSACSHGFEFLIASRFFLGLAVGMSTVAGPMYVAETSPIKYRGFFVGSVQLAITTGIFLAYIVNYVLSESGNWPMMFALGVLPALLLFVAALFVVESPRWLLLNGKTQEAQAVFQRLHNEAWVLEEEEEDKDDQASEPTRFKELFQPLIFPAMLFSCGLFFFQNLSGIDAILYYAPIIFQQTGFTNTENGLQITMGLGAINIIATIISIWLLDKVGRRPVLIYGLLVMCISVTAFSVLSSYSGDSSIIKWLSPPMLMIFVAAFAVSLGPVPYVIMSELFPLRLRMQGIGLASATAWGINALITFAYPVLTSFFGTGNVFFGFAFVCLVALIISILFCPETNKLSLEMIESRLKSGVALRKIGS